MENFNEVAMLWRSDSCMHVPDISKIELIVEEHQRKMKLNNVLVILLLLVILTAIGLLIAFAEFKMWTTYVGLIIWLGIAFSVMHSKLKRQDKLLNYEVLSNHQFLSALEDEETQNCVNKSFGQTILFILWAIGFSFYIYEFIIDEMTYLWSGYGALLCLILFVWFVYRPFMIRRYQHAIRKTIDQIIDLKSQIDD